MALPSDLCPTCGTVLKPTVHGEQLREARDKAGLRLADLVEVSKKQFPERRVTPSHFSEIERAVRGRKVRSWVLQVYRAAGIEV